jgi:hypothetical protein
VGEVLKIAVRGRGMAHYLQRAVARHGLDLFKEDWRLEEAGSSAEYHVVVYRANGTTMVLTDPMALIDFALFWDGFRFCATQMQA